jgi:hypothetical protein
MLVLLALELHGVGEAQVNRLKTMSFRSPDWVQRTVFHSDALQVTRRYPLLGVGGPRRYDEYVGTQIYTGRGIVPDPHMLILNMAAFYGLPVVMVFAATVGVMAASAVRFPQSDARLLSLSMLVYILVFSTTHGGFTQKHFWLALCLAAGAVRAPSGRTLEAPSAGQSPE